MTIHLTKSGSLELIAKGGHGKPFDFRSFASRPACLIADDGDGHYEAWKFEGARADAVATLAPLMLWRKSDRVVAFDGDRSLTVESAPADFWVENEATGDCTPNRAGYPEIVAW